MIQFDSLNKFDNVWLTSDTHYSHRNICRGVSRWYDPSNPNGRSYEDFVKSTRDFDTLEDMNDAIIDGINSNVGENDVLIHAGDVSFGGKSQVSEFVNRVSCKNIVLTFGNHDHHIRRGEFQHLFENVLPANDIQYVQFRGHKIAVCHYPMSIFHQGHLGATHAFGHVHGSYEHIGKTQDVGIDVAYRLFGEYRPFSLQEYLNIVNSKEEHLESHHRA